MNKHNLPVSIKKKNKFNMETIILISVLSTLGVVALVSSIVVMFIKLRKKVDNQQLNTTTEHLYNSIRNLGEDVFDKIKEEIYRIDRITEAERENTCRGFDDVYRSLERLESQLDSRADKLHSLIQEVKNSIVEPTPNISNN